VFPRRAVDPGDSADPHAEQALDVEAVHEAGPDESDAEGSIGIGGQMGLPKFVLSAFWLPARRSLADALRDRNWGRIARHTVGRSGE
jgi:hypothetical protein